MKADRVLIFLFRLLAGGALIYAAVLKISDPLGFAQDVLNYQVVGSTLAFPVAVLLPWVELFAGLGLVSGVLEKGGAFVASVLYAGFIGLVLSVIVRGLDVDCGCFGSLSSKADWRLVAQDAALLAMSLAVFFRATSRANSGHNTIS
jgi:putative oxidoreductase